MKKLLAGALFLSACAPGEFPITFDPITVEDVYVAAIVLGYEGEMLDFQAMDPKQRRMVLGGCLALKKINVESPTLRPFTDAAGALCDEAYTFFAVPMPEPSTE